MKRNATLLILTSLLLASCSSSSSQMAIKKEKKGSSEIQIGEIGSAHGSDRGKRLDFLTKAIDLKKTQAQELNNQALQNETVALELEILTNEMLLLEAEKFGLEDGLDLRQVNEE